jgi:MHS family proline/betaine transporter-like MFS transporter
MHESRNITATIIGNILELYDFTVFAFFAPIISNLFFPKQDPLVALIATFSVFAIGYCMRPIGGIIFGHIGDRVGRKPALLISITIMSLATILIGCLPTYRQLGVTAALLLVFLRLLQGLAAGGELAGSIVYTLEQAPPNRRGFYSSWTTAGAITGVLLGSLVGAIIEILRRLFCKTGVGAFLSGLEFFWAC